MSNGSSDQVISLPKGGGALKGIGEKFSPDLHTGTGNFTVPIALPHGRNGFQPELSLVYSTGTGNGPFGLGWNLGAPGVSRKTSDGVPLYESEDVFILSGAEDLVPVGKSGTTTRFRPRTEGLFARIEHHRDATEHHDYWRVRSKDGPVSYYGTDPEDRPPANVAPNWADPAIVADPDGRHRIFAWKLTKTEDPFGNRIEYEYERDSDQDDAHRWDQLYLKCLRYADYEEDGKSKFLVSVEIIYEDEPNAIPKERPDPFSDYRAGFEIRTRRRCKRIEIHTHADEDRLVRTYDFVYLDERVAAGELSESVLPPNGVSLLSQVRVTGHDEAQEAIEDRTEELPPLEFGYTRFEPEGRDFFPVAGRDLPARSLANPDTELVDLFGNGLPDILEMNGTVRYWRNLGDGEYDLPREMRDAPAGLQLADPGVQMIDADGDGRTDLLVTTNGFSGYYPLRFGGLWDRRSFQRFQVAPSFNLEDPEVRLVDLDGDGVTDVIRSGSRLECFFNDTNGRHRGWTPEKTRWVERRAVEDFPNVNFSDPRVKWADMTGDGLQDIVLVHDGNVEHWPNLGHGNWSKRVSMRNCPRFPFGYDPRRILVGDVDGDGLADIVYVDDTEVTLWLNRSGNGWSDPVTIQGTPPVTDADAVRLVDLLGTGISGVLWSADANGLSRKSMFFLDFTGGTKPYLLSEMDNHMGAVTKVGYAPSTRFYLQDQEQPETRWKTPLPFPIQVVSRVEVIDEISRGKLTTEYCYHHGYWDGAEREFRGFGMVEQLDTETCEVYNEPGLHGEETPFEKVENRNGEKRFSPPTLTKTWFHQGPIGDEFGEWEETHFGAGFSLDDPQLLSRPASVTGFLKQLPRRVKRDALRTLRGRVLRTELYALDSTEREDRPYTVEEYLHGVCEVVDEEGQHELTYKPRLEDSPTVMGDDLPPRVFFPHALAQRSTQWERGDDPMTRFSYTDDYDEYGQPRQQTAVALPRRQAKRRKITGAVVGEIGVDETRILATHTRSEYAVPAQDFYINDRVAQTRTFELDPAYEMKESVPGDLSQMLVDQAAEAEAVHKRFRDLAGVRLINHTLNHYDGAAFTGRDVGDVGPYGALARTESLAFTETELNTAYGDRRPTYLGGAAAPPTGTPAGFGNDLGYRLEQASEAGYHAGYYVDTQRWRFDFQDSASAQQRGFVTAMQDALGNQTDVEPDDYWLMPGVVRDAVGLETRAECDYRVMQPRWVSDPNGNTTHFRYTPLGLLRKQFLQGRNGEGGSDDKPETELTYDFRAYERTRVQDDPQPIFVHARRRVWHASENVSDETIESREYSDGFGRLIQARAQAEELAFGETGDGVGLSSQAGSASGAAAGQRVADRVTVSGWQVYDNKGRAIEKYEPFFAPGWEFQPEEEAKTGRHATLYYDPRGQVIRTVNPDGSEQRVIFGIPNDLGDPDLFDSTPWESFTYDANDLAPLSRDPEEKLPDGTPKSLINRAPEAHHFTPTSAVLDAQGRVICQIERNRSVPKDDWYLTRSRYDVRGNLLAVHDPLGRPAFQHAYDLLNNPLRVESIDRGLRTFVLDAAGNLVEYRDSKGSVALRQYDPLNRLAHLWARDDASSPVTLRELLEYGDGSDGNQPEAERAGNRTANRLGRLYKHHDEAGLLRFDHYDFKGNLAEKQRWVVSDTALRNGWVADWYGSGSEDALDSTPYETSMIYDALDRAVKITYPKEATDLAGHRPVVEPRYNRAGALEKVALDGTPYVTQIAYNAKGQRVLISYGNGVMTRYRYDERTFRLIRLRTERCQDPSPSNDEWKSAGGLLQDLTYGYDLAGNVTSIEDRTPGCGVAKSQHGRGRLVRTFEYDALYRLTKGNGRECKNVGTPRPFEDLPRCGAYTPPYVPVPPVPNHDNAPDETRRYSEAYTYDPAGNLLKLKHVAGNQWTRTFKIEEGSNRLEKVIHKNSPSAFFEYDDNGSMTKQNIERRYTWDYADRLISFTNQPTGSVHSSVEARYLYDAGGERVKKWVRKGGTGDGESTVYVDGVFEHHRWKEIGIPDWKQNNHVHVIDDQSRVALVRRGDDLEEDAGPSVQYHLGDHLGSSSMVVRDDGAWINREEYFPYGETSFGSFARKRYRFTGKERDEESGLCYHGARYYAPWLGRWVSSDLLGLSEGVNTYVYAEQSPIRFVDRTGLFVETDPVHGSHGRMHHPLENDNIRPTANLVKPSQSLYGEPSRTGGGGDNTGLTTGTLKPAPAPKAGDPFREPNPDDPPFLSPMTNEEFAYQHGWYDVYEAEGGRFKPYFTDKVWKDLETGRFVRGMWVPDRELVWNARQVKSQRIKASYAFRNGYWKQVEGRPEAELWAEYAHAQNAESNSQQQEELCAQSTESSSLQPDHPRALLGAALPFLFLVAAAPLIALWYKTFLPEHNWYLLTAATLGVVALLTGVMRLMEPAPTMKPTTTIGVGT